MNLSAKRKPGPRPLLVCGQGGLPKLQLVAADGACAEIYLHGGQVSSWCPAGDGEERLFLSEQAQFRDGSAIRGGIPVIFPWFGPRRQPRHGFARLLEWELVQSGEAGDGAVQATLRLNDSGMSWRHWRHRFVLELTVIVGGPLLTVRLTARNTGLKPFRLTPALHTYLRVDDIAEARLQGLTGCRFRDQLRGAELIDAAPTLTVDGALDRIYFDVERPLLLQQPRRGLQIAASGLPDVVVWNPGPEAGLADLTETDWRQLLCVEAASLGRPVRLAPGESWQGEQRLRA